MPNPNAEYKLVSRTDPYQALSPVLFVHVLDVAPCDRQSDREDDLILEDVVELPR